MSPFNRFVWTDLSTFDMGKARADYGQFFGWHFAGASDYDFARLGARAAAAVFPMPSQLAKLNLPSFWMSYIHVEDLSATVDRARTHKGVIIEVEPEPFGETGRVALVRDPNGAGMTLYEGPNIFDSFAKDEAGSVMGRYYHVPELGRAEAFYQDLFGWTFHPLDAPEAPWPTFAIHHADGDALATAELVPESIRGRFRYWMPCFATTHSAEALETQGASHRIDLYDGRTMLSDRQGASFMISPASLAAQAAPAAPAAKPRPIPWPAVLGLLAIWFAVVFDIRLFWGLLFGLWTWFSLRSGQTGVFGQVSRQHHPSLFWGFIATWALLSLWMTIEGALQFFT